MIFGRFEVVAVGVAIKDENEGGMRTTQGL